MVFVCAVSACFMDSGVQFHKGERKKEKTDHFSPFGGGGTLNLAL